MKKLFLIGMFSILVLTGCGKKQTIVCTQSETKSDASLNSTVTAELEGSRFKVINMEIEITAPDSLLDQKSAIASLLEREYRGFEKQYGVTPVTTETEKGAKVTMRMTSEQAKKFYGSNNDKASRKDVVDLFEKQGYKCK